MSINCWFIFQVGAKSKKSRDALLSDCPSEIHSSDLDRVIVFYEEHRYAGFEALDPDERSEIVERCLGDRVVAKISDPRGVCVQPEVGQDFEGRTYGEIVAAPDNLWVTCVADPRVVLSRHPKRAVSDFIAPLISKDATIVTTEVHPGSRDAKRQAREIGSNYFGDIYKAIFNLADFEAEEVELGFTEFRIRLPLEEAFEDFKRRLKQSSWILTDEKLNRYTGTFHLAAKKGGGNKILIYFNEGTTARIMGKFHGEKGA